MVAGLESIEDIEAGTRLVQTALTPMMITRGSRESTDPDLDIQEDIDTEDLTQRLEDPDIQEDIDPEDLVSHTGELDTLGSHVDATGSEHEYSSLIMLTSQFNSKYYNKFSSF